MNPLAGVILGGVAVGKGAVGRGTVGTGGIASLDGLTDARIFLMLAILESRLESLIGNASFSALSPEVSPDVSFLALFAPR